MVSTFRSPPPNPNVSRVIGHVSITRIAQIGNADFENYLDISLDSIIDSDSRSDILNTLFTEELGALIQIREKDELSFKKCFATCGPPKGLIKNIGFVRPTGGQSLIVRLREEVMVEIRRDQLQSWWSKTSFKMQNTRDNPTCAQAEYSTILNDKDPGLSYNLTFNPADVSLPLLTNIRPRPRVAILREQGCNSHREIAFAFKAAGFDSVDVHMSDVISGYSLVSDFQIFFTLVPLDYRAVLRFLGN